MNTEVGSEIELKKLLLDLGWIGAAEAQLTPLTGGVSSEIYLVRDGERQFVVKRALKKLKVAADWYADTSRNDSEQAYMRYVSRFRPDAMPEIIASDKAAGLFAMEFLDGFENWKASLLSGVADMDLAYRAGKLLGEIHAQSWGDEEAQEAFDTLPNFDQLRVDPYLRATAEKHPHLRAAILEEADRLMRSRNCLVHGDFSPKNILFRSERLVPLDCEVACYADAAFDLSFFLNHFFLKSLYHGREGKRFAKLDDPARRGYREANPAHADEVEAGTARLLPMLMLARVDGKSPVEYLDDDQRDFIRRFVNSERVAGNQNLDTIKNQWLQQLGALKQ
ncbi:aminoglycoside phosphotransferase family protein [Pelagicoccus sp. SDUM812003]|uniref:phosphotransferase family protein n=1 Tax=Pelagicoccus sp. SDUM812003 TaxID=3041267 RepID=UPI00280D37D4|nr:aminoglycoside phosphotransferase family protein [Pelagicoccus sp. SDUM812003]MDQ8201446.1 aminoglycoside phosphotransferase family protein [Pelagicoccus sp. SDUM812003]